MGVRPRNDYPYKYIESLREKTLVVYNDLETKIRFRPNKSRGSLGYKRLRDLLIEHTGKTISFAALVDFFNKQPFIDNDSRESISYEAYTVEAFAELVKKNNVRDSNIYVNKHGTYSLPPQIILYEKLPDQDEDSAKTVEINTQLLENIKSVLHRSFEQNVCTSKIDMKKISDKEGNVIVMVDCYLTTKSEVSVLRVQCFSDDPIVIDDIKVYETVTKKRIPTLLYHLDSTSYFWYLVLPTPLKENSSFYYSYQFVVQGYFKPFFAKGYNVDELVPIPGRYSHITDELYFPNTKKFSTLTVNIEAHPHKDLVGKNIKPEIEGNWKIFKINHGNLKKADTSIKVVMTMEI